MLSSTHRSQLLPNLKTIARHMAIPELRVLGFRGSEMVGGSVASRQSIESAEKWTESGGGGGDYAEARFDG